MKKSVAALLLLITGSAFAVNPTYTSTSYVQGLRTPNAEKIASQTRLSTILSAIAKCKSKHNFCELTSVENIGKSIPESRIQANVMGINESDFKVRQYRTIKVDSGEWATDIPMKSLDVNSIKMSTLQKALSVCDSEKWDYCSIEKVEIKSLNTKTYVNEWNSYAYGTEVTAYVKGIKNELR